MDRRVIWPSLGLLALAGCAGANPLIGTYGSDGVAGFIAGWWHGLICPIAFIASILNHRISIYEVHNSGLSYNAGFVIGGGAWGLLRVGGHDAALQDYDDAELREELANRRLSGDDFDEDLDDLDEE